MYFALFAVLVFQYLVCKEAKALTLEIDTKPVVIGSDYRVSCYLSAEQPWYSFTVIFKSKFACFLSFYRNGSCDTPFLMCNLNFNFTCTNVSFHLEMNNIDEDLNGTTVYCSLSQYGNSIVTSDEIAIAVYDEPVLSIVPTHSPYKLLEGQTNTSFLCRTQNYFPIDLHYQWLKAGIPSAIGDGPIYTIDVVRKSVGGDYTCKASYDSGEKTVSITIKILYLDPLPLFLQQTVTEGNILNVTPSVEANPAVKNQDITWTKQNNGSFTRNGLSFVIDNVNRADSGTYTCTVRKLLTPSNGPSNIVESSETFIINVLYPAEVKLVPDGHIQVLSLYEHFNLLCAVIEGNPNVTSYNWFKDDSGIAIGHDPYYDLQSATNFDQGNYSCEATNGIGAIPVVWTFVAVKGVEDTTCESAGVSTPVVIGAVISSAIVAVAMTTVTVILLMRRQQGSHRNKEGTYDDIGMKQQQNVYDQINN